MVAPLWPSIRGRPPASDYAAHTDTENCKSRKTELRIETNRAKFPIAHLRRKTASISAQTSRPGICKKLCDNSGMGNVATDIMQFFNYSHLPANLAAVSKPFSDLANQLLKTIPANAERTVMLRKLLEAKDCAVRATLAK